MKLSARNQLAGTVVSEIVAVIEASDVMLGIN